MSLPILPTGVVGSYSMPGWLERLKTEYILRRISRQELDEIHDTAVKAAIKDQEVAGVDIITDGELRRDNLIDYFAERLPGVQIDRASKKFYYDFYDSVVRGKMPMARSAWFRITSSSPPIPTARRSSASPVRTRSSNAFATSTTRARKSSRWISRAS